MTADCQKLLRKPVLEKVCLPSSPTVQGLPGLEGVLEAPLAQKPLRAAELELSGED